MSLAKWHYCILKQTHLTLIRDTNMTTCHHSKTLYATIATTILHRYQHQYFGIRFACFYSEYNKTNNI